MWNTIFARLKNHPIIETTFTKKNIMKKLKILMLLLATLSTPWAAIAQSLAGDSIVFGPMFSPVYNDSVRVWVMTKTNTGTNDVLSLEVTAANAPGTPLQGTVHNADDRLGYVLRSFAYAKLVQGQTYTATLRKNGIATARTAIIKNEAAMIDDFEFLTGGCARIYDLSRCIDQPESQTHKNGTPDIFNTMAKEGSDLMIWLGDATYLLGLQHANGQCPDGVDDWANKDMAFARYMFYRKFQDQLTLAMPQLAITDNHDTGPNEFDKTMPTLGEMREIFKDWWPNPQYKNTPEGPGLFSSYVYKDVEYFLLDNRSYRDGIAQQLGPEQMEWFKQTLKKSTATFKVIISGTPAFAKHWGGRNFSVTQQGDDLIKFIQDNNIDGVLCFSADIHEQEFYGKYDTKYPLFNVLSGNLNSDVGDGVIYVDQANDRMMHGVKQTYLRVNVFGDAGDRRMKIEYLDEKGKSYYQVVVHADMLRSLEAQTRKLALSFANALYDSSSYHHDLTASGVAYAADKDGQALSALNFTAASKAQISYSKALTFNDRAYTVSYWVNPASFPASGAAVLSNATATTGVTFSITKDGYLAYTDHATAKTYTSTQKLIVGKWAHITWKYDNVKQLLGLYYNGLFVQSWTGVTSSAVSTASLTLGNSFENKPFTGSLDEVSIQGKLISDESIKDIAGYESNRGDVLKVTSSAMAIPGDKINPALTGDFTIEFWGKLNADPGTNFKILASNARVNGNSTGLSFEFPDSNKLNVVAGTNGSGWNSISEKGDAWNVGEWNHVAVTAKKNGTLIYYVNGVKIAEAAFAAYVPNPGGIGFGYSPGYSGGIQAELDEVRIWNVALPQDSIVKRMYYPLTGKEEGLKYYYDFSANTETTVISKGSETPYAITISGASLTSGTSPVGNIDAPYRNMVTATWSRGNRTNTGLTLPDAITTYAGNVVIGKGKDTGKFARVTPTGNVYYLDAPWQIDPVNMPFATLRFTMSQALPKYDSIAKKASQYYLLQKAADGTFNTISQGSYDGQNVTFFNVFLEEAKYYLGWKADASGAIGRGGALSLTAGHNASIPYQDLNPVLAGPFTIELWARFMQDPPNSAKLLSSNGRVNNNTTGISIEFTDANSANVVLGTNTANWNSMSTNKNWKVGEWYHLAVTFNPNDKATVYLNGEKMTSATVTNYSPNTSWNLALGASVNPAYINGTESIVMMDEFRIWNLVKTQDEIRQQMHLSLKDAGTALVFNYTGDQDDTGNLVNTGTLANTIPYTKAQIVPATSPVSDLDPEYTDAVAASWSARTETTNGLYLNETITNVTENVITGRNKDSHILSLASVKDVYYVKGAWLLNAQNRADGALAVDLAAVFNNADSISAIAKEYYLIQGDPTGNFKIAATGTAAGHVVSFPSLPLDFGTYYLGYKADLNSIIGNQGGAFSLGKGHNVSLPYADVNKAMAGDFTIELWAKLNENPPAFGKLIGFSNSANNYNAGFEFEFQDNNAPQTILGKGAGAGWNTISATTPWNIGEWNHIAATVSPNHEFKLYINGQLIGTNQAGTFQPNTYNLAFATNLFNQNESIVTIDEFRIWNKVKSQQEIQNGMHLAVTTADPNLVYNFTFDRSNDGKIENAGTQGGTYAYTAAQIVPSTGPVRHDIATAYQNTVTANWSLTNETANGLYLKDDLTDVNANLVVGRNADNQILAFGGATDSLYVKGGWWLDPLSVTTGTVKVDLRKVVANPLSIVSQASTWILVKGDPATTAHIPAAIGTYVGNEVQFPGVTLDSGIYYLAWKSGTAAPVTTTYQIKAGKDDAEQEVVSGKMNLTSSDLEFTVDAADQLTGLKFTGIDIPQGAEIKEAYLQFTVDEVNTTDNVNLVVAIEDVADPLDFSTFDYDLTHRLLEYGDTIVWKPGPFASIGDAGADQRTPNIAPLLDSIVNRADWKAGNAILFRLADPASLHMKGYTANTGKRVAQAFENNPANAARLIVTYTIPQRYYNGTFPMARNASWKYDDSGTDRSATNWTSATFNDSDWAYGNATLGYGNGNETTTLSYGADANNKHTTYYLRNIFEVQDYTQYDSLVFDVRRDDGAIVYVNGTEAFRMNMPTGSVTAATLATAAVDGADETKYYRVKTANLLKNGTNVIAVELHQASLTSEDLSFDMEVGYELPPLGPAAYPLTKETEWHYLDNGTSLDAVEWKGIEYKDTDWSIGKGPLGYGDPMNTIISYGPDSNNKYTTAYFRRSIMVDVATLPDNVEIGLRRDDGAIIYINGVEVVRDNMPAGAVTYNTFSATTIDGSAETSYYTFVVPKSVFVNGENQIAVELHNRSANSSDLGFDMYIKDAPVVNPPAECDGKHISCFTSIMPTGQTDKMIIANNHRFQMLFRQDDKYTIGTGTVPGNADFTAYLPVDGSSEKGRLSVNHENTPGGVSIVNVHFNKDTQLWAVDSSQPVDLYNNNLVTTTRNCSGGITPWGTVITCEESLDGGDVNGDGYQDVGWAVEIDPVTAKVKDYGNGKQEKLWALGRMNHENVVIASDKATVYYGEDGGTHCVYKFIANTPGDLTAGTVYVLKLDKPLVNDDPSGPTATWVQVPNATQADRNNITNNAQALGGTNFNGVEDCEISPLDGKIYFTSKGKGRVYRFKDNGSTISEFETFVGGMSYDIQTSQGTFTEAWADGNDNLTFDDRGNLWVLQDGGNYYIWVVRPGHTQSSPQVELFASMPAGSEPTGLTFTPDYRFGFFSVQHPNGNNAVQPDATFGDVKFDRSATIVFALNEDLGAQAPKAGFKADKRTVAIGNPVVFTDTSRNAPTAWKWTFNDGTPATSDKSIETVTYNTTGKYTVTLQVTNAYGTDAVTYTDYIEVTPPAPVADFSASQVKIQAGQSITFTDLSTNTPNQWDWAFNGGTPATSAQAAPVITYNTPGFYDVTLTVANAGGSSAPVTKIRYIEVENVLGVESPFDKGISVYPNPTNGQLTIGISIAGGKEVTAALYDLMGRKLGTLATGKTTATSQTITVNLNDYVQSTQLLILRIQVNGQSTERMIQFVK